MHWRGKVSAVVLESGMGKVTREGNCRIIGCVIFDIRLINEKFFHSHCNRYDGME